MLGLVDPISHEEEGVDDQDEDEACSLQRFPVRHEEGLDRISFPGLDDLQEVLVAVDIIVEVSDPIVVRAPVSFLNMLLDDF